MATGRVVRFDEARGYGFIAPDGGGEDIFMHANALDDEKSAYVPGAQVEFEVLEGERGLKASRVRLVRRPPAVGAPALTTASRESDEDDGELLDVLSAAEFTRELTEAFLEAAPTLTGTQILALRQRVVRLAQRHGWVEG
jgi:CspA family cold shock protein